MQDAMEQGELIPGQTQEASAGQERPVQSNVRARDQAARVRESLVRCPGIEEQRAA
jgi:hypothetical protein